MTVRAESAGSRGRSTAAAPERTCVGCGSRDAQRALIRLKRADDGSLRAVGTGSGRSAYVHDRRECLDGLLRSKGLAKSLRSTVTKEARLELLRDLAAASGPGQTGADRPA